MFDYPISECNIVLLLPQRSLITNLTLRNSYILLIITPAEFVQQMYRDKYKLDRFELRNM